MGDGTEFDRDYYQRHGARACGHPAPAAKPENGIIESGDKLTAHTLRQFLKAADDRGAASRWAWQTSNVDERRRLGEVAQDRLDRADAAYEAARSELVALIDRLDRPAHGHRQRDRYDDMTGHSLAVEWERRQRANGRNVRCTYVGGGWVKSRTYMAPGDGIRERCSDVRAWLRAADQKGSS